VSVDGGGKRCLRLRWREQWKPLLKDDSTDFVSELVWLCENVVETVRERGL
jgi:hypothetical protein